MNDVTKPLAIVSGATGGIGTVVTQYLWQAGYSLLCLGQTLTKIWTLDEWLRTNPSPESDAQWLCRALDLNNKDTSTILLEYLACFSVAPCLLVVCHGGSPVAKNAQDNMIINDIRSVFATDVLGAYRLCEAAWHAMDEHGGSIVLISSLHARTTYPHRLPYSTAKSALSGLTRSLALDWGKDNIRVNAILPWQCTGTRTDMIAAKEGEDTIERYRQKSPLRRLVNPLDVAKTVLFLAQNESITGSEIVIDCGISSSMWHRSFLEGTSGELD